MAEEKKKNTLFKVITLDDIEKFNKNPTDYFKEGNMMGKLEKKELDILQKTYNRQMESQVRSISWFTPKGTNEKVFRIELSNGDKYIGMVNDNYEQHGVGIYTTKTNTEFVGIYKNGCIQYGRRYDKDVDCLFEGEFAGLGKPTFGVTYVKNEQGHMERWDYCGNRRSIYPCRLELNIRYYKKYCDDFVEKNCNIYVKEHKFNQEKLQQKADKLRNKAKDLFKKISVYSVCYKYLNKKKYFFDDFDNIYDVCANFQWDIFQEIFYEKFFDNKTPFSKKQEKFISMFGTLKEIKNKFNGFKKIGEQFSQPIEQIKEQLHLLVNEYNRLINEDKQHQNIKENTKQRDSIVANQINIFSNKDKKNIDSILNNIIIKNNIKPIVKTKNETIQQTNTNIRRNPKYNEKNNIISSIFFERNDRKSQNIQSNKQSNNFRVIGEQNLKFDNNQILNKNKKYLQQEKDFSNNLESIIIDNKNIVGGNYNKDYSKKSKNYFDEIL